MIKLYFKEILKFLKIIFLSFCLFFSIAYLLNLFAHFFPETILLFEYIKIFLFFAIIVVFICIENKPPENFLYIYF